MVDLGLIYKKRDNLIKVIFLYKTVSLDTMYRYSLCKT